MSGGEEEGASRRLSSKRRKALPSLKEEQWKTQRRHVWGRRGELRSVSKVLKFESELNITRAKEAYMVRGGIRRN